MDLSTAKDWIQFTLYAGGVVVALLVWINNRIFKQIDTLIHATAIQKSQIELSQKERCLLLKGQIIILNAIATQTFNGNITEMEEEINCFMRDELHK